MKTISVGALTVRMIIFVILLDRACSHSTNTAHSIHSYLEIETGRKETSHFITSNAMEHSHDMHHQHNGSEGSNLKSAGVGKDSYRECFQHAGMERAESGDHDDSSIVHSEQLDSNTTDLSAPSSNPNENGGWNNTPAEDEYARESSDDSTNEPDHQFTRKDFFSILGLIMLSTIFATIVTFTFLAFMRVSMQFLSRNIVTEELQ